MRVASEVHGETRDAEGYDTARRHGHSRCFGCMQWRGCHVGSGDIGPPPPALPRPTIPLAPWQLQAQLEGDGLDVTGPYEMVPGVITVFVLYEGDGPFSLIFVDEDQGEMRSIESRPGPYNGERVHSVFDGGVGGLAPSRYIGRRGYRPLARAAVPGEGRQRR